MPQNSVFSSTLFWKKQWKIVKQILKKKKIFLKNAANCEEFKHDLNAC